jgi:hypothetical protein
MGGFDDESTSNSLSPYFDYFRFSKENSFSKINQIAKIEFQLTFSLKFEKSDFLRFQKFNEFFSHTHSH